MIYPNQRPDMQAYADSIAAAHGGADSSSEASRTLWGDAWGRLKKNKLAIIAAIWILFIVLIALSADLWVPQTLGDPNATAANMAAESRLPPSLEHPFGTDSLGRDVLCHVVRADKQEDGLGMMRSDLAQAVDYPFRVVAYNAVIHHIGHAETCAPVLAQLGVAVAQHHYRVGVNVPSRLKLNHFLIVVARELVRHML